MSQHLQLIPRQLRATAVVSRAGSSVHPVRRSYSDSVPEASTSSDLQVKNEDSNEREGTLFVDSVLPVQLGIWDVRYYLGYLRQDVLLDRLHSILAHVRASGFRLLSVSPYTKDGGVFVKFAYNADDQKRALEAIMQDFYDKSNAMGGVPSWHGMSRGNVWPVKGQPFREDMHRYASTILKVSFDGPDVQEETLYELLRPYGRIEDITRPQPTPAGMLRSSNVTYRRLRAAVVARNTVNGLSIHPAPTATQLTRLRMTYEVPIQAHVVRDYIASHPRIFLPVLFFLIGTVTYTIFDPIRVFMVEGKVQEWFNFKEYSIYKWLQVTALERFRLASESHEGGPHAPTVWKERKDAEEYLDRYLNDLPNTIAFVHGPQGSGKSSLVFSALKERGRKYIVIDVSELVKANSDVKLVSTLAQQTGYWPVLSVFNSLNNLIDMASVSLIGQKAGLSSSLPDQIKQVLEVVGTGLSRVNASHRKERKRAVEREHLKELQLAERARVQKQIEEGRWHDGRLDCLAGNGVMSELGVGDELFVDVDAAPPALTQQNEKVHQKTEKGAEEMRRKQKSVEDVHAVETMPIVVIKGFGAKGGGSSKDVLLDELSRWAAGLAEGHIAHVVILSDSREEGKGLAKALPSQPLHTIKLSDADTGSALSYVQQKLHDYGTEIHFSREERAVIERLGGRASDLETLVNKVRSGESIHDAFEDIISRSMGEIRKNAFGDDAEDAKNLPWTREQAWALVKRLSKQPQVSYHDVLMEFPFKNDEAPLRGMEHAELIEIDTTNGRPSTINPGKPVYRWVFERLVKDTIFQATQDIAYNEKLIATADSSLKACEQELLTLKDVDAGTATVFGSRSAVTQRSDYLLKKMRASVDKIEALEKENAKLKKTLAKEAAAKESR